MSAFPAYPKDEVTAPIGVALEHDSDDKLDDKRPAGDGDNVYTVDIDASGEHDPFDDVDQKYLVASKTTKFYRGVLLQMILFGA